MHLVHQADDGSFAVVSALYHYGDPDPFISKVYVFLFIYFLKFLVK